ncbi:MAG: family acetyltransferase [Solirubrobacterales bacterium]|nr:family acetyltransferase [Solirubrobacterales bacterium]
MPSSLLRPAAPTDADAIALIHISARAAALPGLREAHPPHDVRRWVRERLLAQDDVWVALDGPLVVGYASRAGHELDHLYVDPSFHGRGHGSALLALMMQRADEPLELWTFQRNARARAFYEHHGFTEIARTDGSGNEEREPDIRYRHAAA